MMWAVWALVVLGVAGHQPQAFPSKAWLLWNGTNGDMEFNNLKTGPNFPSWLEGDLFRNGPGTYSYGSQEFNHWFDGTPFFHKFNVQKGGKVSFVGKQLKAPCRDASKEADKIVGVTFGTISNPPPDYPKIPPCLLPNFTSTPGSNPFDIFEQMGKASATSANATCPTVLQLMTSVAIGRLGPRTLATSDGPFTTEIDPETLDTKHAYLMWDDEVGPGMTCAHPHTSSNGTYYNILVRFDEKKKGLEQALYKVEKGSHTRKLVGGYPLETDRIYKHSWALTENYAILLEQPMELDLLTMATGQPMGCAFKWHPAGKNEWKVIHLKTGAVTTFRAIAPWGPGVGFTANHHINAYEENGEIVIDCVHTFDGQVYNVYYLDVLRNHPRNLVTAQIVTEPFRWRLPIATGKDGQEVWPTPLLNPTRHMELPQINYYGFNGKKYQYAYGATYFDADNSDFWDTLMKVDVVKGTYGLWHEDDIYPSEAVFVARPNPTSEDDGVLLSMCLDAGKKTSFLLVIDAKTMKELDRVYLPVAAPGDVHGVWRYPGGVPTPPS